MPTKVSANAVKEEESPYFQDKAQKKSKGKGPAGHAVKKKNGSYYSLTLHLHQKYRQNRNIIRSIGLRHPAKLFVMIVLAAGFALLLFCYPAADAAAAPVGARMPDRDAAHHLETWRRFQDKLLAQNRRIGAVVMEGVLQRWRG
jgi:hypothetical protein